MLLSRASDAELRAQPIRNRCHLPIPTASVVWSGVVGTGRVTIADLPGAPFAYERADLTGEASVRLYYNVTAAQVELSPGAMYRASVWVWCDVADVQMRIARLDSGGAGVAQIETFRSVVGWQRVSVLFMQPLQAGVGVRIEVRKLTTQPMTMRATKMAITDGSELHDYADGDTPGWRWLGSPGASESVGWPYTLERIAGRPFAALVRTPGDAGSVTVSADMSAEPFGGRSLYVVHDTLTLAGGAYNTIARWGEDASYVNVRGRQAEGSTSSDVRVDALNGSTNRVVASARGSLVGRHVSHMRMTASSIVRFGTDRVGYSSAGVPDVGGGFPWRSLTLAAYGTAFQSIAAFAYRSYHDDAQVEQVMRWLANRYGVLLS